MAAATTSETVNIMTWAWTDYPVISKINKELANSLSVFRNAEVKNHVSENRNIPVLKFRKVTAAAMYIFLSFIKGEDVSKKLNDPCFYPAFPDLLVFIKKNVTNDEYYMYSMQDLYDPLVKKMFDSLACSDDTTIKETKAALLKCRIPIPL